MMKKTLFPYISICDLKTVVVTIMKTKIAYNSINKKDRNILMGKCRVALRNSSHALVT
jgi:hypothetical protein